MSVDVALLKSLRRLMRAYSERSMGKQQFMMQLGMIVCDMEAEAYETQKHGKKAE